MSLKLPVQVLALLALFYVSYLGYGIIASGSMLAATYDCTHVVKDFSPADKFTQEGQLAQMKMISTCANATKQGEAHAKSLGLKP